MYTDTKTPQIYALFAWNEWAEGAVIEPNTVYGEGIGNAIKLAREIVQELIQRGVTALGTPGSDTVYTELYTNLKT